MSRDEAMFGLIGAWYEAATDLRKWPAVLKQVCDVFESDRAHMLGLDLQHSTVWLSIGHNVDAASTEKFLSLVHDDPRTPWILENPGKPMACNLHLPPGTMRASRIYKELFGRPEVDIEYTCGLADHGEDGAHLGLGLMRGKARQPYTHQDCDDVGRLAAHVRNVAFIMRQLEASQAVSEAIREALDKLLTPIAVVDTACRIVHANQAARDDAARGGIVLRHEHLWMNLAADSQTLHDSVASVTREAGGVVAAARRLTCQGPGGRMRSVHVARLEGNHGLDGEARPLALVTVLDPDGRYETVPQVLRRLYGLTHAEADLLAGLIAGARVAEVAARRGTSAETARDQLKSIYRKTGASDQASLVRLVASNPILRASAVGVEAAD